MDTQGLTATKWDTGENKEKFIRQFKAFVLSGFKPEKFTKAFYMRLSLTFGHIAHYNQAGFYRVFFSTTAGKIDFVRQSLEYTCVGDPAFTYSDVERILQTWLREQGILEKLTAELAAEVETRERAELARLQAKYS